LIQMNAMTAPEHSDQLLTVAEAAAQLRCSEPTVRRRIREGQIPAAQLGGRGSSIRIPARALEQWLWLDGARCAVPRASSRKWRADEVVTAWQSFVCGESDDVIVQGERRRGDDPVVQQHPGFFVRDGTPRREWPHVHAEVAARQEREHPPVEADVALPVRPEGFSDRDVVELARDVKVAVGVDSARDASPSSSDRGAGGSSRTTCARSPRTARCEKDR
jgi:excisionase family DNA binding protein